MFFFTLNSAQILKKTCLCSSKSGSFSLVFIFLNLVQLNMFSWCEWDIRYRLVKGNGRLIPQVHCVKFNIQHITLQLLQSVIFNLS